MAIRTRKEGEVMLKLFKDFTKEYNANSLSKEIKISPRGALKILKKLESENLCVSKKLGKARFYKVNLNDLYTRKVIETLLIAETKEKAARWMDEFKQICEETEIMLIFGSAIRNLKEANDIDVMFVYKKKNYKKIQEFITIKNKLLPKRIHDISQTIQDLKENLKKRNPAIVDAIRTGYVMHGHDKVVEVVKHVTVL
jgi:predicted nucleotidyltransferase